jgi:hypothetical protein
MLVLKQRALTGQQPQSQMKQLAASNKLLPKTGEPTDATPDPLTSTNKFNLPGIRSRVQRVFCKKPIRRNLSKDESVSRLIRKLQRCFRVNRTSKMCRSLDLTSSQVTRFKNAVQSVCLGNTFILCCCICCSLYHCNTF